MPDISDKAADYYPYKVNIKCKEIDYFHWNAYFFLNVEENAPFLSQDEFHTVFGNEPGL